MCGIDCAGYVFDSFDEIEPYLENPYENMSATFSLLSSISKHLECYVVAGFPERATDQTLREFGPTDIRHDARPKEEETISNAHLPRIPRKAYNSAMLVGPCGSLIKVFRKHFLYEVDTTWADEGPGFEYIELPRIGRLCVAICMDLNPYTLDTSFNKYELTSFCDRNQIDILVMPMNWLLPEEDIREVNKDLAQPSVPTINYWVARCVPLWVPGLCQPGHEGHNTFLVASNRTGSENGLTFAGSSSVLQFTLSESANLLGALGVDTDGLLYVSTT